MDYCGARIETRRSVTDKVKIRAMARIRAKVRIRVRVSEFVGQRKGQ